MARQLSEIYAEIGNVYINQDIVKEDYEITQADIDKGFTSLFSNVAFESLVFLWRNTPAAIVAPTAAKPSIIFVPFPDVDGGVTFSCSPWKLIFFCTGDWDV